MAFDVASYLLGLLGGIMLGAALMRRHLERGGEGERRG